MEDNNKVSHEIFNNLSIDAIYKLYKANPHFETVILERLIAELKRKPFKKLKRIFKICKEINSAPSAELIIDRIALEPESFEKIYLIRLLGQMKENPVIYRTLINCLSAESDEIVREAILAIGNSNLYRATPRLLSKIQESHSKVKYELIKTIGKLGGEFSGKYLVKFITADDPIAQWEAIHAFASLKASDHIVLLNHFSGTGKKLIVNAILLTFAEIGMEKDLPLIQSFYSADLDPYLLNLYNDCLIKVNHNSILDLDLYISELLVKNISSHEFEEGAKKIRLYEEASIEKILKRKYKAASLETQSKIVKILNMIRCCTDFMLDIVESEENESLKSNVIKILGELRQPNLLDIFKKLQPFESGVVRSELMMAITKIEDGDTFQYFLSLLQIESTSVKLAALRALKNLFPLKKRGDQDFKTLIQILKKIISDDLEDIQIRSRACWVAGELKIVELTDSIIKFLKEENDQKRWAFWSLAHLGTEEAIQYLVSQFYKVNNKYLLENLLKALVECKIQLPFENLSHFFDSIESDLKKYIIRLLMFCDHPVNEIGYFLISNFKLSSDPNKLEIIKVLLLLDTGDEIILNFIIKCFEENEISALQVEETFYSLKNSARLLPVLLETRAISTEILTSFINGIENDSCENFSRIDFSKHKNSPLMTALAEKKMALFFRNEKPLSNLFVSNNPSENQKISDKAFVFNYFEELFITVFGMKNTLVKIDFLHTSLVEFLKKWYLQDEIFKLIHNKFIQTRLNSVVKKNLIHSIKTELLNNKNLEMENYQQSISYCLKKIFHLILTDDFNVNSIYKDFSDLNFWAISLFIFGKNIYLVKNELLLPQIIYLTSEEVDRNLPEYLFKLQYLKNSSLLIAPEFDAYFKTYAETIKLLFNYEAPSFEEVNNY